MRRWLRLAVALTLALIPVVGGVVAAARANPSAMAGLYTLPDGSPCDHPCLFGVSPGVTTDSEAYRRLRTHPLTRDLELVTRAPFRIEGRADRIMMITYNLSADGRVDEITVATYERYTIPVGEARQSLPPVGSLGDVAGQFGDPPLIQITQSDPIAIYPDARLMVSLVRTDTVQERRITMRTPIHKLTVYRHITCPLSGFYFMVPRWLGASHFRRYIRARDVAPVTVRRINSVGATFVPCS